MHIVRIYIHMYRTQNSAIEGAEFVHCLFSIKHALPIAIIDIIN